MDTICGYQSKLDAVEELYRTEYSKRLEDLEFFVLKRRRNQKGHPTLIDLVNERVDRIEAQSKESLALVFAQLERLKSEDRLAAQHLEKLDQQHRQYLSKFELFEL